MSKQKSSVNSRDSSSSDGDYRVMAIKHKRSTELKIAGAQLPIKLNGKSTRVWIDSESPISIFTIGELRRTLGASGTKLDTLSEEDKRKIKSHRRKSPTDNWKRLDDSARTIVGATITTRGPDNVH